MSSPGDNGCGETNSPQSLRHGCKSVSSSGDQRDHGQNDDNESDDVDDRMHSLFPPLVARSTTERCWSGSNLVVIQTPNRPTDQIARQELAPPPPWNNPLQSRVQPGGNVEIDMSRGKPTTPDPAMPQDGATLDASAPIDVTGNASEPGAAAGDARVGPDSQTDETTAAKSVEASGNRFGILPYWALMPRAVAIYLACMVAAGVIVWLVLGWQ